ncbi:MAG: hypothetical protein CM15mP18_2560 [Methanobacteriota archaeon]|nr:MAG: hypothetical protein CM15mP18_2560 [Euryarchaeota archaeon]
MTCRDPGLAPYVNLTTVGVPHTGGRHANAWFGKSKLSVVERYVNKLMRTGKYTGKKQGAMKAFEEALDTMAERSGDNPLPSSLTPSAAAPMEKSPDQVRCRPSQKGPGRLASRPLDIALRNLAAGALRHRKSSAPSRSASSKMTKASTGDVTARRAKRKKSSASPPRLGEPWNPFSAPCGRLFIKVWAVHSPSFWPRANPSDFGQRHAGHRRLDDPRLPGGAKASASPMVAFVLLGKAVFPSVSGVSKPETGFPHAALWL